MIDKVMGLGEMFWLGWAVGVCTIPVTRYCLERFGGPVWQDIKKASYKIWEAIKTPFK